MEELCPKCEGSGFRLVEGADGTRVAQVCECRAARRSERQIAASKIPERYLHCTLDNYVPDYAGKNSSLNAALLRARNFAKNYPVDIYGKGLLFTGPNGTGKTHLVVGIIKELIARGHQCLFVTYGELLTQVRNSYNPAVQETELQVLRPVFDAEILVIDELGSSKPSDWVWDTVAHIINTRYNNMRSTIITTNFANEREFLESDLTAVEMRLREAWIAMYKESLGDRIGERMRSRLFEMCVVTDMMGPDFRKSVPGRANLTKRKYKAEELFLLAEKAKEQQVGDEHVDNEIDASKALSDVKETAKTLKKADKIYGQNGTTEHRGATRIQTASLTEEVVWTQEMVDKAVALATAKHEARKASSAIDMGADGDDD